MTVTSINHKLNFKSCTKLNYQESAGDIVSEKSISSNRKKITGPLWLSKTLCSVFKIKTNKRSPMNIETVDPQPITTSTTFENNAITNSLPEFLPLNKVSSQQEVENTQSNSFSSNQSHEKEIVPLERFLRYSMNRSDRRIFQCRRIIQPFQPKYEVEWQKDQWLQFDNSTNKQIEHLRKNGFSKVAIRKDANLKKYIMYDNPSEIDVLLEVSLHKNKRENELENEPKPIKCHQPSHFCVRRTRWWHTSYEIGEAYLPNWVDPDLCCNTAVMDAASVMAAITNISRATLSSTNSNINSTRFPDTPVISQKSSIEQLKHSPSAFPIKPLQYTEPPFLLEKHVLSAAAAKVY